MAGLLLKELSYVMLLSVLLFGILFLLLVSLQLIGEKIIHVVESKRVRIIK